MPTAAYAALPQPTTLPVYRISNDYLRESAPQFRKTSFKKLKYHSPLEKESQKPSRMAKADAEGGQRGACEWERRTQGTRL